MSDDYTIDQLRIYLDQVERSVDVAKLLHGTLATRDVQRYYLHSGRAYRLLHSYRGAMHMSFNYGHSPQRDDLLGQVRAVQALVETQCAQYVVELGCGNGYNLIALAERLPAIKLVGVDISPTNLARAKKIGGSRLSLIAGDFNRIPIQSHSIDLVFAIESLCHSLTTLDPLEEASRILHEEGHLVIFDAFRADQFAELDPTVQYAASLVEKSMAVTNAQSLSVWAEAARCAGFEIISSSDFTAAIRPNLIRLHHLAEPIFRHPWMARGSSRLAEGFLIQNAIAGLLMPFTTSMGAHSYRELVLRRVTPNATEFSAPTQAKAPLRSTNAGNGASPRTITSSKERELHHARYRTSHADYRTWVDVVLEEKPGREPLRVLLIALGYYAIGLFSAEVGGFPLQYMMTPAVYVFLVASTFGLLLIRQGSKSIHGAFEQLRPVFVIDDEDYRESIDRWFTRFVSLRGSLKTGLLFYIAYVLAVLLVVYGRTITQDAGLLALRSGLFGHDWYTSAHVVGKTIVFFWIGILPAFLLGAGVRICVLAWIFLWDLRNWQVIPLTEVVRTRLRLCVNFFMAVALGWFVGEGIVSLMFIGNFRNLFFITMGTMLAIGATIMLLPQFIFRQYLLKSHYEMCTWALKMLHEASDRTLSERTIVEGGFIRPWMGARGGEPEAPLIHHLVEATAKPNLWVYDSEDILVLFLGQLAVLATLVLQVYALR